MIPLMTGYSFACSLLAGFFLLRLLLRPLSGSAVLNMILSVALGLAVSSVLHFFWIVGFPEWAGYYWIFESGTVFILGLCAARTCVERAGSDRFSPEKFFPGAIFFKISFVVAFLLAAYKFIYYVRILPYGDWDAWAVWNVRARILFKSISTQSFTPAVLNTSEWPCPDYPLFLANLISKIWVSAGAELWVVPAILGGFFLFGVTGIVFFTIRVVRGSIIAYAAAILFVGTPFLIQHGASQYADVPMMFWVAASLSTFIFSTLERNIKGWTVLSGFFGAMAAWTKNEGLVFFAWIFITTSLWWMTAKGMPRIQKILHFSAGALGPIFAVYLLKMSTRFDNPVASALGSSEFFKKIMNWETHVKIGSLYFENLIHFGQWQIYFLPALILYGILTAKDSGTALRGSQKIILNLPALGMLLVFYFTYFASPFNVEWHIRNSLNRLFLQLWPILIIGFFCCLGRSAKISSDD